jgi:hypothetical protein
MRPRDDEQYRHECECRDWIRRGYINPAKMAELRQRLQEKRGGKAADRVIKGVEDMLKYPRPSEAKEN